MAEDDDTQRSPFTRPGFIVGAVVVAAIIVAAIVLTVLNLNRDDDAAPPAPDPSSSATSSAAPEPSAVAGGASICGLEGVELSGARGVLVNITASRSLKMKEVKENRGNARHLGARLGPHFHYYPLSGSRRRPLPQISFDLVEDPVSKVL